ncbi:MAG: hypothetical protein A2Y25_12050 [Candidatus Melainabacteria bacterium GWF2_37_15]|nr:MAG: hypothetical protein A2Y25_12050 [Candidatus Melainabacteria bacterium GWF2_37_15]
MSYIREEVVGMGRDEYQKIQEVTKFFKKHVAKVGEKQAIKDLQKAINMLNKGRKDSLIEEKRPLKEDGILGEKTYASFGYICKNYTARLINKFIRRAAINNTIFETKNDKTINTEKNINKIYNNLRTQQEEMALWMKK